MTDQSQGKRPGVMIPIPQVSSPYQNFVNTYHPGPDTWQCCDACVNLLLLWSNFTKKVISQNSTTHVIFTKKDGFHERIHYVGQNIIIIATDQIFTLPVSIVQCQPGRVQHGTSKCLPILISIECLNVA